jgi:hypothetical protein
MKQSEKNAVASETTALNVDFERWGRAFLLLIIRPAEIPAVDDNVRPNLVHVESWVVELVQPWVQYAQLAAFSEAGLKFSGVRVSEGYDAVKTVAKRQLRLVLPVFVRAKRDKEFRDAALALVHMHGKDAVDPVLDLLHGSDIANTELPL